MGAGQEQPDVELAFRTENSRDLPQRVLPTFAAVLGDIGMPPIGPVALSALRHAGQSVSLRGELPVDGHARGTTTVAGIYDKGRHALVRLETELRDAVTGVLHAHVGSSLFVLGAGGWGGDAGPKAEWDVPARAPDAIRRHQTGRGQALLYRLSGDLNPLHSDPAVATSAGLGRPILHGLCTFGYAGRALLDVVCEGEPALFGSMSVRFAAPVYPGRRLTTSIWRTPTGCLFRTFADGQLVLDHGVFELRRRCCNEQYASTSI